MPYDVARLPRKIKLRRDTVAGLKNGNRNQGKSRFCPDTNSALHENALSQALGGYAFLQIVFEI